MGTWIIMSVVSVAGLLVGFWLADERIERRQREEGSRQCR
jgi:hypothetical protein